MTQHTALSEALAKTVQEVPGVAFLKPGVAHRLRSALSGAPAGGSSVSGLRISRSGGARGGDGAWRIDVQIVTRADARALDVTRATRKAVDLCMAVMAPAETARVTVTVTGMV